MPSPARPSLAKANARHLPPGAVVHRTAQQSESDPYEFVMATGAVDRVGDVIEIGGMDVDAFKNNPIALWQHDPASPIGTWENVRKAAGRLVGSLKLAAAGTSPLIDRLRALIEQRILQTVSVGFRIIDAEWIDPDSDSWAMRFLKSELLECSLVSIPANSEARRIRTLDPHPADATIFSAANPAVSDRIERSRAGAASPRRQLALTGKGARKMPRTIAERLVAHQTRSAAIDAEIQTINDNAEAEDNRDFSADELATLDALNEEKSVQTEAVRILTATEAQMASRALPVGNGMPRALVPAQVARKELPGSMLAKLASVAVLSYLQKQPAETIIARRYAADDRVGACFGMVQKTATNIADSVTPGWAAELVRHDVAAFMADLEQVSVFAALRARASTQDYSLDGVGSLSIPRRTPGGLAGAWVGEAGVIPVLQGVLGAAKLEPTKLAGITAFSKELATATNDQIETVLRNGMRMDTAEMLDGYLLDAVPKVAGVRPAGLRNGANSAASGGPDAISGDILAALGPILTARGGQDIVLIMNTAQWTALTLAENALGMPLYPETANGQLKGYGVIVSNTVPAGVVLVVEASAFASAAGVPDIDVSEEATLTMANADATAPTQAVDFTGAIGTAGHVLPGGGILVAGGPAGAGTAGYQAMSMFQQWSVALRLVMPVHWVMTRDDMVSVITGVDWGNP